MKLGLSMISAAWLAVSHSAFPAQAADPAQVTTPSAEQSRLAAKIVESTGARANAKAMVDRILAPARNELKHDYPDSGIAEWSDRYAARLADTQYQQMLADFALMDVQRLRDMAAAGQTPAGKAVLPALEDGALGGQPAMMSVIDQSDTPESRRQTRLELLRGACAEMSCPPAARREIAQSAAR